MYFCKELEEAALSYILEHFETIANSASEELNGLGCQELEELLGYDELNVRTEEHAFKAIVKWISIDPASRSQNMSKSLYFYTKKGLYLTLFGAKSKFQPSYWPKFGLVQ